MRLPTTTLIALALMAAPAAASEVGPFLHATQLATSPVPTSPAQIAADPTIFEFARLLTGDAYAGRIELLSWAGLSQSGARSRAGNVLVAPPTAADQQLWVGAASWNAYLGSLTTSGVWSYAVRTQQDWHFRLGSVAAPAGALSTVDGSPTVLGAPLPYGQIVVELPIRIVAGGSPGWQLGTYNGNPTTAGVWQVPAGQGISQAQQNPANRLANLAPILSTFSPRNGTWLVRFNAAPGGAWSLDVDKNGDHVIDASVSSAAGGLPATVAGVDGSSGLLTSFDSVTAGSTQISYVPLTLAYWRAKPVASFDAATYAATEGGSQPAVTIVLNKPGIATGSVVVSASQPGQVAVAGAVVFPAGATSAPVAISVVDDAIVEGPLDITLTLTNAINLDVNPAPAVLTITDNDQQPETGPTVAFTASTFHILDQAPRDGAVFVSSSEPWVDPSTLSGWSHDLSEVPLPEPVDGADTFRLGLRGFQLGADEVTVATDDAVLDTPAYTTWSDGTETFVVARWEFAFNGATQAAYAVLSPSQGVTVTYPAVDPRFPAIAVNGQRPWRVAGGSTATAVVGIDPALVVPGTDLTVDVDATFSVFGPYVDGVDLRVTPSLSQPVLVNLAFSGPPVLNGFTGNRTIPLQFGLLFTSNRSIVDLEGDQTEVTQVLPGPGYVVGTPSIATATFEDYIHAGFTSAITEAVVGDTAVPVTIALNRPVDRALSLRLVPRWSSTAALPSEITVTVPAHATNLTTALPVGAPLSASDAFWIEIVPQQLGELDSEGSLIRVVVLPSANG